MTLMTPRQAPLVFDIHGVLLGREEPSGHRGAGEVLSELRLAGYPVRFLTNTSSTPRDQLCHQLAKAGIEARESEIYTAAQSVAHHLRRARSDGRTPSLQVIGSEQLRSEIRAHCGDTVRWAEQPEEADTVVISRDPSLTDALLERLGKCDSLELIATCRDRHFPNGGRVDTGPGTTVERVERALGKRAQVLGKPNPYVLTQVMGLAPEILPYTVVIGDSVDQDIALSRHAGTRSVLLLDAGHEQDPDKPEPEFQADHTIQALDQLLTLLKVVS